jgi:hypothetical protein
MSAPDFRLGAVCFSMVAQAGSHLERETVSPLPVVVTVEMTFTLGSKPRR